MREVHQDTPKEDWQKNSKKGIDYVMDMLGNGGGKLKILLKILLEMSSNLIVTYLLDNKLVSAPDLDHVLHSNFQGVIITPVVALL